MTATSQPAAAAAASRAARQRVLDAAAAVLGRGRRAGHLRDAVDHADARPARQHAVAQRAVADRVPEGEEVAQRGVDDLARELLVRRHTLVVGDQGRVDDHAQPGVQLLVAAAGEPRCRAPPPARPPGRGRARSRTLRAGSRGRSAARRSPDRRGGRPRPASARRAPRRRARRRRAPEARRTRVPRPCCRASPARRSTPRHRATGVTNPPRGAAAAAISCASARSIRAANSIPQNTRTA